MKLYIYAYLHIVCPHSHLSMYIIDLFYNIFIDDTHASDFSYLYLLGSTHTVLIYLCNTV